MRKKTPKNLPSISPCGPGPRRVLFLDNGLHFGYTKPKSNALTGQKRMSPPSQRAAAWCKAARAARANSPLSSLLNRNAKSD